MFQECLFGELTDKLQNKMRRIDTMFSALAVVYLPRQIDYWSVSYHVIDSEVDCVVLRVKVGGVIFQYADVFEFYFLDDYVKHQVNMAFLAVEHEIRKLNESE